MADLLGSCCLRAILAILLLAGFFSEHGRAAGQCREGASEHWTPIEQAAWQSLAQGQEFDAAIYAPNDLRRRVVRTGFLTEVLTCQPRYGALSQRGLALKSVVVPDEVDLSLFDVPVRFSCRDCFIARLVAQRSRWRAPLVLDGTQLQRGLDLRFARFDDELRGRALRSSADLLLDQAFVARTLDLMGARSKGRLSLRDGQVGEKLKLDGASLEVLDLGGTEIGGQLILSGIAIGRQAVLDRMTVGGDLLLRTYPDGPKPTIGLQDSGQEVRSPAEQRATNPHYVLVLNNTSIAGRLEIAQARIHGPVSLDAIRVDEDIWLRDCSLVAGPIEMPFARVGQNFDLSTTQLLSVNATGSKIGGELRLGTTKNPRLTAPIWRATGRLILRNVSVSAWVDAADSALPRYDTCEAVEGRADPWPRQIDVIGFSYDGAGGLGEGVESERSDDWYVAWLSRQEPFSLDPYRRLASYLRENGRESVAKGVLYAGKERQLSNADLHTTILLFLQKILVGYGIYIWYMLFWVVGFIVLGGVIFSRTEEAKSSIVPLRFTYSTDMFLPFVHFRKVHGDIEFQGPVRYYLYFHKLMGWICASFFLSALVGLFEV